MSKYKIPAIIVALVCAVLGCGTYLLQRSRKKVNTSALSDEPKSVATAEVKASTYRAIRRYVGTLEPWLSARMGPQLASGFADSVLVRPGSVVSKGQVLATIDCRNASTESQAIAHQARALAERQKAATHETERLSGLLDGGFAAANEVEQKQAQNAATEAQMEALLAQAAGKSLAVNDCVLRSPFDGEVSLRLADPGTFVRPGAGVVEIIDRSIVRLALDVPEIDFEAVRPDTPVHVHVLATSLERTGKVTRRSPSADPSTRTIHVEVDLPNEKRDIPVQTTAEVRVEVGDAIPAIEIPLLAAKIRGNRATVFVVDGNTAKKVQVEVLGEREGSLFVKTDLQPGARVVTEGRSTLAQGDRIQTKSGE